MIPNGYNKLIASKQENFAPLTLFSSRLILNPFDPLKSLFCKLQSEKDVSFKSQFLKILSIKLHLKKVEETMAEHLKSNFLKFIFSKLLYFKKQLFSLLIGKAIAPQTNLCH